MARRQEVDKWSILRQLIFPGSCVLCGSSRAAAPGLCPACEQELPAAECSCDRCGLPLATQGTCGRCLQHPLPFDRTRAAFLYGPPLDRLITSLKFGGRLALAELLGGLMVQRLRPFDVLPDTLVPVPLHPRRLRQRGYNQAVELARPLARALGVPLGAELCRRTRATPSQSELNREARARNVRGAFEAAPLTGQRVALIDDVMTTGATVASLAQAVRRAGAVRVEVWVLARAVQRG